MKQDLERYRGVLEQSEMFRGLVDDERLELLGAMRARVVRYAKGETIYRVGDGVTESALVLEGTVIVDASDAEGDDTNLNMLRRGDEFGAFLVLSGSKCSPMHVYAGARCTILVYDLLSIVAKPVRSENEAKLINNIILSFAGKCVDLYQKVRIYGEKRIRGRIRLYLMSLPIADDEVTLPMNRTALASYLRVDRTALAREITRMQEDGLIAVNKRRVRLLDRDFFQIATEARQ